MFAAFCLGGQGVAGPNPVVPTVVMSQDIGDSRTCNLGPVVAIFGWVPLVLRSAGSRWGVEEEFCDELSGDAPSRRVEEQ